MNGLDSQMFNGWRPNDDELKIMFVVVYDDVARR